MSEHTSSPTDVQVYMRADGVYLLYDLRIQKAGQDDLIKLWSLKSRIFLEYRRSILESVEHVTDESRCATVTGTYEEWLQAGGLKNQKKDQKLQPKSKKGKASVEKVKEREDRDFDPTLFDEYSDNERMTYKKAADLQEDDDWYYEDEEEQQP